MCVCAYVYKHMHAWVGYSLVLYPYICSVWSFCECIPLCFYQLSWLMTSMSIWFFFLADFFFRVSIFLLQISDHFFIFITFLSRLLSWFSCFICLFVSSMWSLIPLISRTVKSYSIVSALIIFGFWSWGVVSLLRFHSSLFFCHRFLVSLLSFAHLLW